MPDVEVTYLRPKASNLSSVAPCTATEVLFERQGLQRPCPARWITTGVPALECARRDGRRMVDGAAQGVLVPHSAISMVVAELLEGSKATSSPSKGDAILESPLSFLLCALHPVVAMAGTLQQLISNKECRFCLWRM